MTRAASAWSITGNWSSTPPSSNPWPPRSGPPPRSGSCASPRVNIFSAWGMVFVNSLYTFPYVFTFVANSLDSIPSELEEASAMLGARPWRTALHITLPLALPALLAGFLVAFLQSMTLFGTPAILAMPAGVEVITTKIWSLFQFPPRLGLAAAASLPLLPITIGLLKAQTAIMGRRSYAVIGGKGGGQQRIRLGAWKIPALALFAFVLGCSIALPYGVLLRTSFVKNWARPLAGNLTLEHWKFVFFEFSQTQLALQNTFVLGIAAASAGTILITAVSYFSLRKAVWGHRALSFLATAPVAIPGIVLAVGLFLSYTRPPLVLYGTLWIIFLAYLTKELPVGFQQISASLRAVHPELEDAGRIFGATRLRALFDITAPLIRNGVIATWIFIFIGSIRELSATILLFTARTKTISVTMFDLRESNDWGPIAVLSTSMLVITFALIASVYRFTDRRPTGIGPEICARVLADRQRLADAARLLVVGDARVLEQGARDAGVSVAWKTYAAPEDVDWSRDEVPLIDLGNLDPRSIRRCEVSAESGRICGETLAYLIRLALVGRLDGIAFAPLNKAALHAGGWRFADEHQLFADLTGHLGSFGEMNVVDGLWMSRVTSHVSLRAALDQITAERIEEALLLADRTMRSAGMTRPRIAVAALNPH